MQNLVTVQSIEEVLKLTESGSTARKNIAAALRISLTDAGRLAHAMISAGIIKEYRKNDRSPGRNAGILIPANDPVFAIAHISLDRITTDYFGFGLKISERSVHDIEDHLFIDDVFTAYFNQISKRRPSLYGICLVCDGHPNDSSFKASTIPGIDDLPLLAIAEEHLHECSVTIENRYAHSLSDSSEVDVILTDEYSFPRCYILHNGSIIGGKNCLHGIPDLYSDASRRKSTSALRYAKTNNEYVGVMTEIICHIISLISPDRIIFKSGRYSRSDEIMLRIKEALIVDCKIPISDLPEFVTEGEVFDLSQPFLRRKIRNNHITRTVNALSEK